MSWQPRSYLDTVIQQAHEWDAGRPRSQQRTAGWSNMADCRAYLGFIERGDWASDDEENWRAIAGTALHEWMQQLRSVKAPEFQLNLEFDVPVSYGGIPGHADEVKRSPLDKSFTLEVTDWKFPRLASARLWDDPDVLEEKFVQVHGYAAGLSTDDAGCLVRMLVMPVDGTFEDWKVYERPFDRGVADRAVERWEHVREAVRAGQELPKDKPLFWCERFCEFFRLCRGSESYGREWPLITDEETAAAVERYGTAAELARLSEKVKKELAPLLQGARGSARGWRVSMTRRGEMRLVPDEDAIAREYEEDGREVPTRWAPGAPPRLNVRREKPQ